MSSSGNESAAAPAFPPEPGVGSTVPDNKPIPVRFSFNGKPQATAEGGRSRLRLAVKQSRWIDTEK